MKTNPLVLFLLLPALLLSACQSPTTTVASANYAAGRAFATYELTKTPPNQATLDGLVAALKTIASVTSVPTPFQMGVISGQLQELKSAGAATPNTTITDIASVVDTAVQTYKNATGSNPTLITAANAAIIQDFINGVTDEESFLAGQASVLK